MQLDDREPRDEINRWCPKYAIKSIFTSAVLPQSRVISLFQIPPGREFALC